MRHKTIKSGTFTLQGFTPLLYATETGNIDCMKALLDHGATVAWQVRLFHILQSLPKVVGTPMPFKIFRVLSLFCVSHRSGSPLPPSNNVESQAETLTFVKMYHLY